MLEQVQPFMPSTSARLIRLSNGEYRCQFGDEKELRKPVLEGVEVIFVLEVSSEPANLVRVAAESVRTEADQRGIGRIATFAETKGFEDLAENRR